jgi:UDP-N-acetylglucosamine:LPS N-acetylglucosamine transferase
MMTNVPVLSCQKISNETGRHLPMFTVVTDLGSAHCLWFANGVEKMFVGSEQVKQLAKVRGKVPDEKLIQAGLPIRHDFALEAEKLGDRMSSDGIAYQEQVRRALLLPHTDRQVILCMGGGEGVGSLSNIVDALYVELVSQGIDALVLVVCGRNDKLRNDLATRDWAKVFSQWSTAKARYGTNKPTMMGACGTGLSSTGCIETSTVTGSIRRMLSSGSLNVGNMISLPTEEDHLGVGPEEKKEEYKAQLLEVSSIALADSIEGKMPGNVHVEGLGFVTRMAEYMVASDVLVTKAGPGTISEAAALGLPVMLTSL